MVTVYRIWSQPPISGEGFGTKSSKMRTMMGISPCLNPLSAGKVLESTIVGTSGTPSLTRCLNPLSAGKVLETLYVAHLYQESPHSAQSPISGEGFGTY